MSLRFWIVSEAARLPVRGFLVTILSLFLSPPLRFLCVLGLRPSHVWLTFDCEVLLQERWGLLMTSAILWWAVASTRLHPMVAF